MVIFCSLVRLPYNMVVSPSFSYSWSHWHQCSFLHRTFSFSGFATFSADTLLAYCELTHLRIFDIPYFFRLFIWLWIDIILCFYPCYASAGISRRFVSVCVCVCVCLFVCLPVTRRYCIKMDKRRIMQTTPSDSPGTLVFWRQQLLVNDPIPIEICAQSDTHPFRSQQFRPISAHSTSTLRAGEKSSMSTNRKSTTRFPTSHRWPVYKSMSPKGWHKSDFAVFASKIQLISTEICYKVCVKTSSGRVVATSFPCLTVRRWIAATSPST